MILEQLTTSLKKIQPVFKKQIGIKCNGELPQLQLRRKNMIGFQVLRRHNITIRNVLNLKYYFIILARQGGPVPMFEIIHM